MHVMIDLETLDTTSTSVVLSIGAVKFNKEGLQETFYKTLFIDEQRAKGRTISTSTLLWWMKQDKSVLFQALEESELVTNVLYCLLSYLGEDTQGIWGNGSDFDNAIMGNICGQYGLRWPYLLNRCYRTMKNLFPTDSPPKTEAHNALADAKWQAEHLIMIAKAHNLEL